MASQDLQKIVDDCLWEVTTYRTDGREFIVLYKTDGKSHFIKPVNDYTSFCSHCQTDVKGYHNAEYEALFGFGCHCEGFDPLKVVDVTDRLKKKHAGLPVC